MFHRTRKLLTALNTAFITGKTILRPAHGHTPCHAYLNAANCTATEISVQLQICILPITSMNRAKLYGTPRTHDPG